MDGDDTLEYGKAQYTEADIIPCSGAGEDQGEAREREALRGAVLKYDTWTPTCVDRYERTLVARDNICLSCSGGMPSNRITPEFSKWANDGE